MRDVQQELYDFLLGKSYNGLDILSNIFYKQINSTSFKFISEKESVEDLLSEFIVKLLEKREYISNLVIEKNTNLASYIREMIRNFLKDKIEEISKAKFEDISQYESNLTDDKKFTEYVIAKLDAYDLKKLIEESFVKDDMLVLCYLVEKECQEFMEKEFFSNVTKDALYKRVERLKKKLAKFIDHYGFSKESVDFYLKNLLPQICKKVIEVKTL